MLPGWIGETPLEQRSDINILDSAAASLARQIAFCGREAEKCLNVVWANRTGHDDRMTYFNQVERFMRLSAELAGAIARLKTDTNTRRQIISVEHIERSVSPADAVEQPAPPLATYGRIEAIADTGADEMMEHTGEDAGAEVPEETCDVAPAPDARTEQRKNFAIHFAQNRIGQAARDRRENEDTIRRLIDTAEPEPRDFEAADAEIARRESWGRGEGSGVVKTNQCGRTVE